ncbi:hypothetical protein chiPu_0029286, partial [Chiloscyllium punctatum]|nr:hypothetical protein [Chiloscyllium punctatum]
MGKLAEQWPGDWSGLRPSWLAWLFFSCVLAFPPTGIVVYGLARCCSSAVDPFGPRREEVEIHLRFVTDSIHLYVLFVVNLVVLSTYLPQEGLKLVPLLTAFFALA